MKKPISIVLIISLICIVLSGCGAKNSLVPSGAKIFKVEDYGAQGDGKTDDSAAIADAINAAIDSGKAAAVKFKKNTTYYVPSSKLNSEGLQCAFILKNAKDIALIGDNTTILIRTPLKFMHIESCENIAVQGFNFDYENKPYTVSAIEEVNVKEKYAVIKSEHSLEISGVWTAVSGADFFGLPVLSGRHHMYIGKIEPLDGENRYKLYFSHDDAALSERLYLISVSKPDFLTPIPDVAHTIGEAFTINENENFTMADCEVWSAPQFVFNIRGNKGVMNFNNVNIRPNPDSDDVMTAWRDGYHCKDNRAKITWNNCITMGLHDDAYNISSTLLTVTKVISDTEFQMTCTEYNGMYFPLQKGDELVAYNVETGEAIGTTRVSEVVKQSGSFNVIKVEDPLKGLAVNDVKIAFNTFCAPGTELNNCTVDGSVRFRGEMKATDCDFKLIYMWIQNETLYEGPIPKNMLFEHCKFEGCADGAKFLTIRTVQNGLGMPEYYCDNIVFKGCKINPDLVDVAKNCKVTFTK